MKSNIIISFVGTKIQEKVCRIYFTWMTNQQTNMPCWEISNIYEEEYIFTKNSLLTRIDKYLVDFAYYLRHYQDTNESKLFTNGRGAREPRLNLWSDLTKDFYVGDVPVGCLKTAQRWSKLPNVNGAPTLNFLSSLYNWGGSVINIKATKLW